jgi:hypothetical protein
MRIQFANAQSWYNGVSFAVQKRLSNGFQTQASFTYSKARDQGSGITSTGDELPQSQRGSYAWDLDKKTGLSSFDVRKMFTANLSWEFPFGKSLTGVAGVLAKGWQLNAVVTLTDGYPLTILDTQQAQIDRIAGQGELITPNLVPGGNANPVLGGPNQYFDPTQFVPSTVGYFGTVPRNTLISPGLETVDLSLFKNVELGKGNRIQVRIEVFNLLNRANFGSPNTTVITTTGAFDPAAGQITATRTPARQVQLGFKWMF